MKNKRKSLIWQFLALMFFTLGTFTARAQNCTYVANIPPTGSFTINGLTVTSSSTGYAVAEGIASPLATCFGAGSYGLYGSLRVGHNTATWGVDNAAWSTTLTFSKPVNDIVIFIAGTGSVNDAGHTNNEKFSFTSNGGAISITSTIKCASTISGNTITSGAGTNGISTGGGIFQLHAPAAFTTLTMSGLGGLDGSNIGLCRATLACIALNDLKPPVKNLSNICPTTTVNLNNAHTGTVPVGTSLKWFTNNAHTGTALSGTQITQAGAGTYYAFYNDSTDPASPACWSPASDPVTVTINACSSICVTGDCNPNTYLNSSDPNTIEYDNMISTYHSTMARESDGTVKIWGQGTMQNGTTNGNTYSYNTPTAITSTNYGTGTNQLSGKILKFAAASEGGLRQQFCVLTENGLYFWGDEGSLVALDNATNNVSTGSFRKAKVGTYGVNSGATKADGLPDGVTPADVKMMFGTTFALAIVTCNGQAWVLSNTKSAYGDGATDNATNDKLWHRVSTAANTPLTNVVAVRGIGRTLFALTSTGDLYTWGTSSRLGGAVAGQTLASRDYATLMIKPAGVTPKMIGMTSKETDGTKTVYYLLATDGNLYAMGDNSTYQLGDGTTTNSNIWKQVNFTKTINGTTYTLSNNVKWISPSEHDAHAGLGAIDILDTDAKLWTLGAKSSPFGYDNGQNYMPGSITGAYDAGKLNLTDRVIAVEAGGHTNIIAKGCANRYGYVGHRVYGSMGDGTYANDNSVQEYNFSQTGILSICGATTVPDVKDLKKCAAATANLANAEPAILPPNTTIEWWLDAAGTIPVPNPAAVQAGVYYASFGGIADKCIKQITVSNYIATDPEFASCVAPAPAIALKKTGLLSVDGNTVTYTFTVKNTGNTTLNPVTVTDVKLTPNNVTLAATSLAPGAETTGTATYTVTAAEKSAGQVENTATASGTPPTGSPVTDVSGTDFTNDTPTVVAVPNADLSVVKTASSLTPTIGQQVTFSIVAANAGPSAATGVTVNDQIPAGYTLVSASPSTGTWTAPNWNIGNLASGASATLTVTATVNATGPYANTATITGNQPDPNPGNNTDTETPVPTPAPAPAIALIKTGVVSANGNTITYTFTVRNTGNVPLTSVNVTDAKLSPTTVTLATTNLAAGQETTGTATYTVTAAEREAGQVENTATATGTPPTGPAVTDVSGTDFTNNNPTVVPVPGADLSVTKTASTLTPTIGQQVTFTIVASNAGPSAATGVTVNDQIPAGYTVISATPSTGTWTAPNWNIGNLANGASATLTVTATVNASGSYANTATITGNEPDPNPNNNTDTETPVPTQAPAPAIALQKTGVLSGDGNTITYTFTVRNTGNVTLNPVVVTDPKLTPSNVTLAATSLAPGAETTGTATYTVTAAEKTAGQVQNTATATGTPPTGSPVTDVSGTDFTNNNPTVVPVPNADLQVTKVVSDEYPSVGGQVTFTVTAKNNGPSNATGVVVNDMLPSGYVFLNAIPSTGVWSAPNWTIGSLANGASASMTIVATVAGTGNHENTATITGNQPDSTPGNNTDSAITYPGSGTDLEVTKTPNNFTPNVGDQITFTVTAKNNGPRTGTGVTVTDVLPSGYTFVSAAPSQGVWSAPVWSVGTLASGASASITMVATVNPTGNYTNTAVVSGVEPDPTPENNTATVTPDPSAITDLEVSKVVNNQTPNIGEQVTFTITAKNNGPRNATGVVVNDQLPSGYTYVSHTASIGTWTAPNWSVGNMASGASATLTIVATVNATGTYANTATIKGEQPDDKPDNSTDTEVTSPGQGTDLEVIKVVDSTSPNVGDNVTFTITAKNNGPRNATGVVVTDQVPSGFVVLNATPSTGTWTSPNWNIGTLANGASATLTIVATVNATGNYTNAASIDGNETDPNPDNNEDEATTPSPENVTDLEVVKVADNMTPAAGSTVTFTITAKNNGPKNATGVVVQDAVPSGYVVMSVTPSRGNWAAPNWSIGTLANGASATMTVVAVVNATGNYANTATITGNQVDPNPNNNTSTVTPTPPANTPSIALVKTGVISTNGNTITYSFTVTNTGNTTLTNVAVNDPKLTPTSVMLLATTLAPGASTTGTGTYTVTAADKTAGSVSNTATATGNPPTGNPVTDVSGTTQTNDTPTVVVIPSAPSIALVKTGVLSTDGNTITYSFTVTNTGNTTLTNVAVNDPKLTPSNVTLLATTLAPGASTTGTGTYTVTPADRTAGSVSNTATATGNPPTGSPVTDVSGTTQTNDTPTVVPVDNDSSIALVKTGVLSADGNSIAYTFTVTNTGDVTLTNVKVIDPKMTPSNIPLLATTLAPGASTTGTATYTLTEADKLGGQVSNTAITTGTTPSGCEVVDISGTQQNNDTPTVVVLPCKPDLNPAITVLPNNGIAGQRDMVVLLDIKEILGCATKAGEEIRVSVAKVSDFSFNWGTYATATTIPTASVTGLENGSWTFTETSTAWVWVYNGGIINANEISNIGFMGIWNAEASSGKLDFTVTIRNGSGGESNTLNNVDYETVTYDVAP